MKFSFLLMLGVMLTGCVSIRQYYVTVPTDEIETIDYEGEVVPELVQSLNFDDLVLKRAAEDYVLVGRADFGAPSEEDWTGAMTRLGKEIKAGKIDYFTRYERTETVTDSMVIPHMYTAYGTAWGPYGCEPVIMTSTVDHHMPYSYSVSCNEYHVYFFKKAKNPSVFGLFLSEPSDAQAKRAGTRKAVVVRGVVPRKLAWKNELFKDDIILSVDGKTASFGSVQAIDHAPVGRKLKLWRDGKIIEKTIVN